MLSDNILGTLPDTICPSETAEQDIATSELLILKEANARAANSFVPDGEASSTYSGWSAISKASQVSAGDGVVVKGLKQNLKHFMSAQKALNKHTGFWTRIAYRKLNAKVKYLGHALEDACRMLSGYVAGAEKFEMEFKYSGDWKHDPFDLGEMLNDISTLVESTILEPLSANTEQVFAALDQIYYYVQLYRACLAAVLVYTARESDVDLDEVSKLFAQSTVDGKTSDRGSGKASSPNTFKDKSKNSATRKAKEHPLRKEGGSKGKLDGRRTTSAKLDSALPTAKGTKEQGNEIPSL